MGHLGVGINTKDQCSVGPYLVAELPEDLHVKGFESVSVGVDEVEAAVHAVVHDVLAVQAALVAEVPLELEWKHSTMVRV